MLDSHNLRNKTQAEKMFSQYACSIGDWSGNVVDLLCWELPFLRCVCCGRGCYVIEQGEGQFQGKVPLPPHQTLF